MLRAAALLLPFALLAPRAVRAHPGRAIVVDRLGRIYFVDTIRNRLWRLTADGTLTQVADGVHTDRLFLWPDGRPVPGEDYIRPILRRADSAAHGDVGLRVALRNEECLFFSFVDSSGNVYCRVPPRFFRIDSSGVATALARDTTLAVLEAGTVAPGGRVYVADRRKILRVAADSTLTLFAGSDSGGLADGVGAAARFGRVLALAADRAGAVYVVDHGNARVRRIAPDGAVTTVAKLAWPWRPTGIAVDPGGGVYVLERRFAYGTLVGALVTGRLADFLGGPRVQRIWPHGTVTTVATVGGSPLAGPVVVAIVVGLLFAVARGARRLMRRLMAPL